MLSDKTSLIGKGFAYKKQAPKSLTQQESVTLHHNVFECFYDVMKEKINIETSGGVHGQIQRYIA